jgi:RNA polymerase sigma-70 factor (ECF subfamily)
LKLKQQIEISKELLKACKRQKPKAIAVLYTHYSGQLYNTSFRLVKNSHDAEDAVHEAFIAAYKAFPRYDVSKSPEKWLKTLVINKSIDMLRKKKTYLTDLEYIADFVEEDDIQMNGIEPDIVREALMNLSDGYRSVLSMYLLEGLDYSEMSEYLKIKESSVRSHVSRGIKILRENLTKMHYAG